MKIFKCQQCAQILYFENGTCVGCRHRLGYLPDRGQMSAVRPDGTDWVALAAPEGRYRFCANWELSACNWMVPAGGGETYCLACRHNRTIPDVSDPDNHRKWQQIEEAKRRLFYSLIKLRLPRPVSGDGHPEPLVFDFLADRPDGGEKVLTGHDQGQITLALNEADSVRREQMRAGMGEAYRTLLGHFRHEIGHYYWDRLVRDAGNLESCRALFGDERTDYGEALQRHYDNGPPADWQQHYVSAYATMHPWEDWAESWAHYLHIVDTLEMAGAFGIAIAPEVDDDGTMETNIDFDPHKAHRIATVVDAWLPLTFAVNSLNRSMGQPDLYPFVLPPDAVAKLGYIHDLIRQGR
ncbi:zinc-binding metallopeptidase family protein [Zavarzinia compransoris]|uniref:Zinc-ribbon domain-containing protein n=1 Tax=Zavarzinia compransoris TaxID=1264899 RepID=A0A317DWR4_9PROT|nr:putative zinc-binding peptidase [Zavarzinia compransoris]PWR19129.1 hypothetical protein DKG75_19430 [Zavarzinia compransoris]TDP49141.1 hypothetical protein DES42_101508 [Zavarzinia compransoris]